MICAFAHIKFRAEHKLSKSSSHFVQQNVSQVANLYRVHFFKTILFMYKSFVITCTFLWTSKLYFKSSIKALKFRLTFVPTAFINKRICIGKNCPYRFSLTFEHIKLRISPYHAKKVQTFIPFVFPPCPKKISVGFIDN